MRGEQVRSLPRPSPLPLSRRRERGSNATFQHVGEDQAVARMVSSPVARGETAIAYNVRPLT